MSAERTPPTDNSLLSAPLEWLTRGVLCIPRAVVVGAVVLAVAAAGMAVMRLGFRTSRLDLLSPESAYNKLWLEYLDEFGEGDDAVVVVEGRSQQEVIAAIDAIAQRLLGETALFSAVLHKIDLEKIRGKGLHYLTVEELQEIRRGLEQIDPVIQNGWSQLRVDRQLGIGARAPHNVSPQQQAEHLERLSISLAAAIEGQSGTYVSPWPLAGDRLTTLTENARPQYLLANDGRVGFILLRLNSKDEGFAPGAEAIDRLRTLVVQTQPHHPAVSIGVTGLPVMESDEMRSSQSDMATASLISLVGVACLFMAGLGGVRHPLMTVCTLLLAMAWSLGYITLSVGHLNILSVSFGVILIGLGIDFGIHYVARYLQLRREGTDCRAALVQTAGAVGPGVITGAVTTALAFFAAYFTNFVGVAELGLIAGGGILLCLMGAVFVLPAMIYLADSQPASVGAAVPLRVDRWIAPLVRIHGVTLPVAVLMTGALAMGIAHVTYDHNLLNLQAEGLESVELERRLLEETDHSVWYAISVADTREELLRRKQEFGRLATVDRTEEIVSLLPESEAAKGPIIADIHARLHNLPRRPEIIPVGEPEEIAQALTAAASAMPEGTHESAATRTRLQRAGDVLQALPAREAYARISGYQQQAAVDLLSQLHRLRSVSQPAPPELADLPPALVTRFVGRNDRHLLKIYGRGDIWDMDALEKFVGEVKGVDPGATGQPLQTYYASRQMQRSYMIAALYALAAVTVVLLLDFRSFTMTLLALLPVVLGMVQMFGLMGWLGIPLNPANMIVLPLILGIGLDDGVHVVHDFRGQAGRSYRVSSSTAMAVLITSLTTMVGFGSLMFASHRGLESLGRVLTIGVTCCLVSSLVVLPALLRWIGQQAKLRANESSTEYAGEAEETEERSADEKVGNIRPKRRAA